MKPTSKLPPRTPRKGVEKRTGQDPVKVYCRVRPTSSPNDSVCLKVVPPTKIQLTPPDSTASTRPGPCKEVQYTFRHVFEETTQQKELFTNVALPLVDDLIRGRNGLLFTYGVTGGGKTFTMVGGLADCGILPRCLDVLFNSIGKLVAPKFSFKPDKMNGFEVLCDLEILKERSLELGNMKAPKSTQKRKFSKERVRDTTKLEVDEGYNYSVFVTFIEIYNNCVYDLLEDVTEDALRTRGLQTKVIREDARHGMYAHGVTETEITSADEGFDAFCKGQARRRIAETALNMESSRSHSIFSVRLVQMPTGAEEGVGVCVSQLALVDLAGSERTSRTQASGERQREAGKINNSLMSLRVCFEELRKRQASGSGDGHVPYRDSRLTLLFKSFFEGQGQIRMIVCVNPHVDDYDETMQVMKFAELSQEVLVMRAGATREAAAAASATLVTVRKRTGSSSKESVAEKRSKSSSESSESVCQLWPSLLLAGHSDEGTLAALADFVNARITARNALYESLHAKAVALRRQLVETERSAQASALDFACAKATIESERQRLVEAESRAVQGEVRLAESRRNATQAERELSAIKLQLREKDAKLNQRDIEKERTKQKFKSRMEEERERIEREATIKLKKREAELKSRNACRAEKLSQVRRILCEPDGRRVVGNAISRFEAQSCESLAPPPAPKPTPRAAPPVLRSRRSRSAGDVWLDHRSGVPSLSTLMQPCMGRRVPVRELSRVRDLAATASKYCLTTQGHAPDGAVETRLYKGDVVPTCGGGAQMVFNDVETLRQDSPVKSPPAPRT